MGVYSNRHFSKNLNFGTINRGQKGEKKRNFGTFFSLQKVTQKINSCTATSISHHDALKEVADAVVELMPDTGMVSSRDRTIHSSKDIHFAKPLRPWERFGLASS